MGIEPVSVEVIWIDDVEATLLYQFKGAWTIEELISAIEKSGDLYDEQSMPVNIIYDLTHGRRIPPKFMSAMGYMREKAGPQVKFRVIVGASTMTTVFYNIFDLLIPHVTRTFHFVDTLEEATHHLR